jgi:L-amino acid N-acyltransferase YncA
MIIRDAVEGDIPVITAIFNSVIDSSNSVYREERVPQSERLEWFRDKKSHGYPIIVIELEGVVVGYGGFGSFRQAQGYRFTVEHTIHVAESYRKRGLGRAILTELIHRATKGGYHLMIGAIDSDNVGSIKLHEEFGFAECARIKDAALKHGKYLTLVLMEKVLN